MSYGTLAGPARAPYRSRRIWKTLKIPLRGPYDARTGIARDTRGVLRIIRPNHKCTAVSNRTGPVAWCDHENSTDVKILRALHAALRAKNRTGDKNRTGPVLGCDWGITQKMFPFDDVIEFGVTFWIVSAGTEYYHIMKTALCFNVPRLLLPSVCVSPLKIYNCNFTARHGEHRREIKLRGSSCFVTFFMMTSSNGNIFRVTGPLCGEFTGPGEFPTQGQWRGALIFSLICVWLNGWVNNCEAGDLRRHRGHYDVNVMVYHWSTLHPYLIKIHRWTARHASHYLRTLSTDRWGLTIRYGSPIEILIISNSTFLPGVINSDVTPRYDPWQLCALVSSCRKSFLWKTAVKPLIYAAPIPKT